MFDANDLSNLDSKYFSIIFTDAFDVTIMSRNTGHFWFIHNPEYPTPWTVSYSTSTRHLIHITSTVVRIV